MDVNRAFFRRFITPAIGLVAGATIALACSRPFTSDAGTVEPFCRLPSRDHFALVYVNDRANNTFRLTSAESQGQSFPAMKLEEMKATARPVQRAEGTTLLWHDNPTCYAYHGTLSIRYPC